MDSSLSAGHQLSPSNTNVNNNNSNNVKLKRCRHGRLIAKDTSKKKGEPDQNGQNSLAAFGRQSTTQSTVQLQMSPQPPPKPSPQQAPIQQTQSQQQHQHLKDDIQLSKQSIDNINIDDSNATEPAATLKRSVSQVSSTASPSNVSTSSDIYDPEGPILPISPCDSPPLSPILAAANLKANRRLDDDVPSSAVQLNHQEKYLRKLNRQERVIEEVKIALKPHYQSRSIDKEQYKDVLRRAVPKICHIKDGEINPTKIRSLVERYVKSMRRNK